MSEKRALRILYSINGSSQYILAKSPAPVPVELIPCNQLGTDTNGASSSRSVAPTAPRFASASFKTCLNVICRSSPELIQDRARDFSVYLLDPLETECPPAQTNRLPQAPTPDSPLEARVAVGLGLMSWELKSDETEVKPVTGTLKVSGTGQEVLEIIFSLREVRALFTVTLCALIFPCRPWLWKRLRYRRHYDHGVNRAPLPASGGPPVSGKRNQVPTQAENQNRMRL